MSLVAPRPQRGLPKARFHSVALVVADRQRAVARYTEKFGLDIIEHGPGTDSRGGVVGRKGEVGGVHLCDIPSFDPQCPVEPGTSGLDFRIPGDLRAGCAALRAHGVRFSVSPRRRSRGWEAQIVDPDGNVLRLTPE